MATMIDLKTVELAKKEPCHFIPSEIHFDGTADVNGHFVTTISETENNKSSKNEFTASFRGRPLNGQELTVPSGYTGIVLNEPHKRATEEESRRMIVTHTFDKFTHWNLDRQPGQDDLVQRAFQWIDLSSAIHKPVEKTEDQAEKKESST